VSAQSGSPPRREAILADLPARPEDFDLFRLGRLLLLLSAVDQSKQHRPLDIERLGFYDFFAANPFLVFQDDDRAKRELELAGFDSRSLSYQSSGHRFVTRRARMQHDLSRLVAYGLVGAGAVGGRLAFDLTDQGRDTANAFTALYARAYRRSAEIVVAKLNPLSDRRLHEQASEWLEAKSFLIDLYDVDLETPE
jgi:hypothetical protein